MVETQLSPGFMEPSALWLLEVFGPLVWVCLFVFFVRQSIRARTLTLGLLLLISGTTMAWQEFYADWGGYLLFNPKFRLMPWGTTLWTTPNKPWALIPAYGWFWPVLFLLLLSLVAKLRSRFPQLGRTAAVLIVTVPIIYVWDVSVETSFAARGWFSYVNYWGPAIVTSKGNFPLIYPEILIDLFAVVAVWVLSHRGPDGRVLFESSFGIERIRSSVARGTIRIVVWILAMNVTMLVFLTIPVIAVRELFDVPSTLVP